MNTKSWGAWARDFLYLIIRTDVGDHSEDTCNFKNSNTSDDERVNPEGGLRGSNTF